VPFDLQVHDTYFIVAHFHYVILGGVAFPLFGALYLWFPKITGRFLGESLGKLHFWLFFAGVNLTFFPMHLLGLDGMTRRVYTYLPESGWGKLNLLATIGAGVIAASVVVFAWNVVASLARGRRASANPWGASTLEWATTSPPEPWGFRQIPMCTSRTPLWASEGGHAGVVLVDELPVVTGLRTDRRDTLITTALDAVPDNLHEDPEESTWPLWMALAIGVTFIGAIFTPWAYVVGFACVTVGFAGWAWPRGNKPQDVVMPRGGRKLGAVRSVR
jgi:cytochrome c oxidase subunit I+III